MDVQLWIEAEHMADEVDDFCNIVVAMPTGEQYAMNIWTFGFFEQAVKEGEMHASPEIADLYMHPPDLFVKDLTRVTVEQVVGDLIMQGRLPERCLVPPETAST